MHRVPKARRPRLMVRISITAAASEATLSSRPARLLAEK